MKIAIVVGTRPEIIKMSSIIKYCTNHKIDYDIIHTQQHYSESMDKVFFETLKINYPKLGLGINSSAPHIQVASIIERCGEIFSSTNYDIVLVQGDTNTVMGAAISAQKCGVKIGHVEAGLRSFDKTMPEEINRIITDQISDYCFCPTQVGRDNLLREGIEDDKIFVVGNTIVDAIYDNRGSLDFCELLRQFNINNKYILVTMHRPTNVDNPSNLKTLVETFNSIYCKFGYDIILPVHPRTQKHIEENGISAGNITMIEPVDYFSFLALINGSSLIITDSGGIQEEACIMKRPCITIRDNTERPETISVGANILTGIDKSKIFRAIEKWGNNSLQWENPFGGGKSGEMIMKTVIDKVG